MGTDFLAGPVAIQQRVTCLN